MLTGASGFAGSHILHYPLRSNGRHLKPEGSKQKPPLPLVRVTCLVRGNDDTEALLRLTQTPVSSAPVAACVFRSICRALGGARFRLQRLHALFWLGI